jgi:hypothetical protein
MRNERSFHIEKIGIIHLGMDGSDEYVLLTANQSATTDEIFDLMIHRVYRSIDQQTGGYYCDNVTVMPHPVLDDQFVCVIHHRYDF